MTTRSRSALASLGFSKLSGQESDCLFKSGENPNDSSDYQTIIGHIPSILQYHKILAVMENKCGNILKVKFYFKKNSRDTFCFIKFHSDQLARNSIGIVNNKDLLKTGRNLTSYLLKPSSSLLIYMKVNDYTDMQVSKFLLSKVYGNPIMTILFRQFEYLVVGLDFTSYQNANIGFYKLSSETCRFKSNRFTTGMVVDLPQFV